MTARRRETRALRANDASSTDPRERLMRAAEDLFAARPYAETTVAQICARAGIATGSFYASFASKRELLVELVRSINRDVRDAMRERISDATDQRDVEARGFDAFFDVMSGRPHVYRIVREAEFIAPEAFREYYETLARGYSRGVRRAQMRGGVDPELDPEVVAYAYMGIGYFVGMRWAEWTGGGDVPQDVRAEVLTMLSRALPPKTKGES